MSGQALYTHMKDCKKAVKEPVQVVPRDLIPAMSSNTTLNISKQRTDDYILLGGDGEMR